jgi:chromosome segregation protein
LDELTTQVTSLEKERHELETAAQKLRDGLDSIKMEWQSLEVRKSTIEEEFAKIEVNILDTINNLQETANEEEWEARSQELGAKIDRLGPINLAAIEEYKAESERTEYLQAQRTDLTEALETLENAIKKIDKETKSKFQETFDAVNTNFKVLFPKLFGGGEAYLTLTGEDLLETGVSVMARPPGKKNSSIQLLSGGEKALTAVSLVFSIFQLNPAPFCMLDEVDAPLDDSNVGRFCRMIQEMAEKVQFIFITHNKITMEIAKQLAGVTMKEPGVSRLVAVDIDEAVKLVDA